MMCISQRMAKRPSISWKVTILPSLPLTSAFPLIRRQAIGKIIGSSEKMQGIFTTVRRVATTDVSVLIAGESGTGKELIAMAIHSHSVRKNNPFIPINCGAIPGNLMESELFGHEKGAFTGAHIQRKGRIELANGGT